MKKLLQKSLLFVAPIILLLALLPVNRRFKYQGLKDDCFNHGLWIHDRIFVNKDPIDLAFIGSSHTINGIDDQLINEKLANAKVTNLGYCRLGRNLSYILLKETLETKKPKHLILEVREGEDRFSHPVFPFIATTDEVLLPSLLFNADIFVDIWDHFVSKIDISQDYLYENAAPIRTNEFGFASSPDTVSKELLDEIELKPPKKEKSDLERTFHSKFALSYLERINDLCQENNITMTFLYLPSFGTHKTVPSEYENYLKYGKVLLLPKEMLQNKDLWSDEGHFNQAGAHELALWVSDKIKTEFY